MIEDDVHPEDRGDYEQLETVPEPDTDGEATSTVQQSPVLDAAMERVTGGTTTGVPGTGPAVARPCRVPLFPRRYGPASDYADVSYS